MKELEQKIVKKKEEIEGELAVVKERLDQSYGKNKTLNETLFNERKKILALEKEILNLKSQNNKLFQDLELKDKTIQELRVESESETNWKKQAAQVGLEINSENAELRERVKELLTGGDYEERHLET